MFSGEITPDEVWDCITHLPRTSATMSALADDPDVKPGDPRPPAMAEFSPERESLALIADRLSSLLVNVIALGGGKPPKIKPHPRPGDDRREAAEKARWQEKWRKHKELAARVLRPKPGTGGGDS